MSTVNPYESSYSTFVIEATVDERVAFIRRTYAHLAGAVLAFVGLEALVLSSQTVHDQILQTFSATPYLWLVMLIGFMAASWVAQRWAHNTASPAMQYAGLGLYTLAEVVIFAPLLVIAGYYGGDHVIPTAGIMTGIIFLGLTAFAFVTKADFSFLRGILWLGTFAAFGFIIASIFLDFSLGLVFCSLMVTLAAGWILYDTSNVLHHYRTDQHVGASLELFASLALLFWYVLRIVMIFASDD